MIRRKQDRCYTDIKDLELVVDKEIVECKYEEKELNDLDLVVVRCQTPIRQLSPTPLERHRYSRLALHACSKYYFSFTKETIT